MRPNIYFWNNNLLKYEHDADPLTSEEKPRAT